MARELRDGGLGSGSVVLAGPTRRRRRPSRRFVADLQSQYLALAVGATDSVNLGQQMLDMDTHQPRTRQRADGGTPGQLQPVPVLRAAAEPAVPGDHGGGRPAAAATCPDARTTRLRFVRALAGITKSAMKKELEWIRRQPKARGTKAKYRVQAFEGLKETASKRLDNDEIKLEINIPRMGSKVVELHKVSKGFDGKTLIKDLSYTFLRREKVGVIGPNGTGKSTLLNLITGSLTPDKGKVVVGDTVVFGYFTQQGIQFKEGQRVIDTVKDIAEVIPLSKGQKITASQLLERFLFTKDMHYNLVDSLSGGEQRRLHLLKVLMNNPNFLILDEPTNDLDVFTLQILEEYLLDFPGVVLIVSHDRHFMDKLVDHCFVFEGGGVMRDFPGNYTQYRIQSAAEEKAKKENKKITKTEKIASTEAEKTKLTYAEKMEFEALEGEIDTLEQSLKELSDSLTRSNDTEDLLAITEKIGEVQKRLEAKTQRWMHLAEFEM